MLERFTDRANSVYTRANTEAHVLNHDEIEPEHVLLAFLKDDIAVASHVLKNREINYEKTRDAVIRHSPPGRPRIADKELRPSERTKQLFQEAVRTARSMNHNYIGTEHMLIGLAESGETIATIALIELGVNLDDIRKDVVAILEMGLSPAEYPVNLNDDQIPRETLQQLMEVMCTAFNDIRRLIRDRKHNQAACLAVAMQPIAGKLSSIPRPYLEALIENLRDYQSEFYDPASDERHRFNYAARIIEILGDWYD